SDRFGRKRVYMLGAALIGGYGFVYFALLDTRVAGLVALAIVLSLVPHDMMYGPQAALIAESFTERLRYSGASLGYQLSSLIAGGPAPLIATALLSHYHSAWPIAVFIFGCAIVSLVATAMLKDRTNEDISHD
ncbi:MAG TPA: MFS transporter, partial [Bryobacteraceae bacterium]|nr:MFS transporter [Bryobacteraceae bacterium]